MKITEETKIKDIIPEGYELEGIVNKDGIEVDLFVDKYEVIKFKKKPEKNFEWYRDEYLKGEYNMFTTDVNKWPWRYKIDLFKFICEDNNINWKDYFIYCTGLHGYYMQIYDICISIIPEEFINSIIEGK